MFNPKVLVFSGAAGFVLSFIAGLFSGAPFGILLLRALLCAVGAAGFVVLVSFLVQKFLMDDMDGVLAETDVPSGGSAVDITLDDNPLGEDDESSLFFVPAPLSEAVNGEAAVSFENGAGSVPTEKANPAEQRSAVYIPPVSADNIASDGGGLDALPDIVSMFSENAPAPADSSETRASVVSDVLSVSDTGAGVDTKVMVQAIRTILSKDT